MAVSLCPDRRNWKSLYRATILEKDTTVISEKISRAEEAIVARARELFYKGGPREEQKSSRRYSLGGTMTGSVCLSALAVILAIGSFAAAQPQP